MRAGQTRSGPAERVANLLGRYRADALGVVLNGCSSAELDYGGYGYGYGYYGRDDAYFAEDTGRKGKDAGNGAATGPVATNGSNGAAAPANGVSSRQRCRGSRQWRERLQRPCRATSPLSRADDRGERATVGIRARSPLRGGADDRRWHRRRAWPSEPLADGDCGSRSGARVGPAPAARACWSPQSPSGAAAHDTPSSAPRPPGSRWSSPAARMWHEPRLVEIADVLDGAGIAFRVLKGPALAALDYPDVQRRPTGDIDLLVQADQIDPASGILVDLGGRRLDPDPVPGFVATVGKGATWPCPTASRSTCTVCWCGDRWAYACPPKSCGTRAGGSNGADAGSRPSAWRRRCCTPAPTSWSSAGGGRSPCRDVAQVLANPNLDPDRAIQLARRWNSEALLATGVLLAQRELGLDDTVFGDRSLVLEWARGFVPRWRDRLWLRVERPDDPIGALEAVATYAELRTADERRVFRAATFRPDPGSYPSATDRLRRVVTRNLRSVTGSRHGR